MQSFLDMKTVLVGYVIVSVLCLAVVMPLWRSNHKRRPEVDFWLADYVLQFLALLLLALRGAIPDLLSIVVANAFVVGGTVVLHIGLQRYLDRRGSQAHNYVMLAAFTAVQTYFTVVRPDLPARNVNLSIGLLFICSQIAWLTLRGVDTKMRQATRGVGVVMTAYATLSLVRVFIDLAGPRAQDMFASGLFDTAVVLAFEMLFIALTFALLLMVNNRLVSDLETDIGVRELAEQRLRELSHHDPLTGLLNSRAFHDAAVDKLRNIGSAHASLVYLDLDLLKDVNDTYGHAGGDAALVALAGALRRAFRESDLVSRMGGDEFAVLAISREATTNETLVSRFTSELAAVNNAATLPFTISASLGIAAWDAEAGDPDLETLIRMADERMYAVKRQKRAP
jgi:diguanylate cyclase (GGDEF)-like protein